MSGNIFQVDPFDAQDEELFQTLWTGRGVRVERVVSSGQASPPGFWYDQNEDEWVALVEGWAELEYADGSRVKLRKGDWLLIPAHRRHRVAFTSKTPFCVWVAVFAPMSECGRVSF
ncbi:MAG: cupin domain-containing protein [Synergistaceae bacterium]|nr:cupin domain-containing protein [Synergistaceae bacterium]